jgi:hypothetical protein
VCLVRWYFLASAAKGAPANPAVTRTAIASLIFIMVDPSYAQVGANRAVCHLTSIKCVDMACGRPTRRVCPGAFGRLRISPRGAAVSYPVSERETMGDHDREIDAVFADMGMPQRGPVG